MIYNDKRWRLVLLIILVAFTFYLILLVRPIVPTFILAAVLAYLLNPIVCWLEKNHINRTFAIIIIYFTIIALTFLIIILGFPKVIRELNEFAEAIPLYSQQVREFVQHIQTNYQRIDLPESVKQVIDEMIGRIEVLILTLIRQFADGMINLFSQLLYIIIAPVLAFYILKDWEQLEKRFYRVIPGSWREHIARLLTEIHVVLKKIIRGHLIVALIVGILTAVSLALLGVKFALTLGIIAGLADIIPYFGPLIGAVPAIMVGLLDSKALVIKIAVVMLIIQQLENNIITPKVLGDSLGLHPLTIIFVLLASGHLFGLIGMLLAVPVTAIIRTVLIFVYNYFDNLIT